MPSAGRKWGSLNEAHPQSTGLPSFPVSSPGSIGLKKLVAPALLFFPRKKFLQALIMCIVFLCFQHVCVFLFGNEMVKQMPRSRATLMRLVGGKEVAGGEAEAEWCPPIPFHIKVFWSWHPQIALIFSAARSHYGLDSNILFLKFSFSSAASQISLPRTTAFPRFFFWKYEHLLYPLCMSPNTSFLDSSPCSLEPWFKS